MHLDVQDLKTFYYRTRLGRAAQKAIREKVLEIWPEAQGQTIAGFGFAVPLLRPYLPTARRVVGLMPAPQGVMPWPLGLPNVSVLCEEALWPLATGVVDKMIMLHGLETSENPSEVLEECSRVLGPGGRVLFVVPNRAGLWARSDQTPFGFGRPYSLSQIENQLKRHGFFPTRHEVALFQPPSHKKFWLRAAAFCERVGQRISSRYAGGVLIVEASKQTYQPTGTETRDKRPDPIRILEGIAKPVRNPVILRVGRARCGQTNRYEAGEQ